MEKYAGFWIRFVAMMVDGIIIIIPGMITQSIIGVLLIIIKTNTLFSNVIMFISSLVIPWIYFILMTHFKGATLGKMLVGITVKSEDSQKLSLNNVIIRETIGKFISSIILCIGYIMAAFTPKKQGLHDMMAHSIVVYKDPTAKHSTGLIVGIILAAILPAIAILGILSSVVLASLSSARMKGNDAATRSQISSIAPQVELYYSIKNSYSKAVDCNSGVFADQNIQQIFSSMKNKNITCFAENTSYAISARLLENEASFCLDSGGTKNAGIATSDGSKAFCSPQDPAIRVNY